MRRYSKVQAEIKLTLFLLSHCLCGDAPGHLSSQPVTRRWGTAILSLLQMLTPLLLFKVTLYQTHLQCTHFISENILGTVSKPFKLRAGREEFGPNHSHPRPSEGLPDSNSLSLYCPSHSFPFQVPSPVPVPWDQFPCLNQISVS